MLFISSKSFFRSQDILTFVLIFWSCGKSGLIRKTRLISKYRRHNLVNKQLQHIYSPIFQQVKGTRQ